MKDDWLILALVLLGISLILVMAYLAAAGNVARALQLLGVAAIGVVALIAILQGISYIARLLVIRWMVDK